MKIENEHITEVTVSVCKDMLGMEIERSTSPVDTAAAENVASIVISGNDSKTIHVTACQQAANHISSAMFGVDASDLDESEITDAVCEIVNMIGGNIKGIMNNECDLSIPEFTKGPSADFTPGETAVAFELSGGTLQVTCS